MNNLAKIAALPGSGGGSMSAMKAEEGAGLAKPVETITVWPTLEAFKATVQMKAPYFQEHDELVFPPIDLGMVGE
jgi:formiminotetrahydrofolate cyclodeaminase